MKLEFDCDEANRAHVREHDVSPEEAEQVVVNDPVDFEAQFRNDELRTAQVGRTDSGRILVVVTTQRDLKLRVVTAFPASKKRREFYERKSNQDRQSS